MHTSNLTFCLFFGAVILSVFGQFTSYFSTPCEQRTGGRKLALTLVVFAAILSAAAGWKASIDWGALPKSPSGLQPGELWDDGGIPVIVKKRQS